MNLTKQQKLEAYTYCLLMALQPDISERWVCHRLKEYFRMEIGYLNVNIEITFPEFFAQKPKGVRLAWWNATDTGGPFDSSCNADRLSAIERAIELTEKLP